MTDENRIGEALRSARTAKQMSLSSVAQRAGISVATLSRIETNKQNIGVGLLIELAAILGVPPAAILPGTEQPAHSRRDVLVREISNASPYERAQLFIEIARHSRSTTARGDLNAHMDTLLSAVDLMREELLALRRAVRRRK